MLLFEKFLTFVSGEKFANYINSSQHLIYMIFRAIWLFCNGRIARKFMRDMVVFWKPKNMIYFESAEEEEGGRFQIRKNEDTVYIVSVLFFAFSL